MSSKKGNTSFFDDDFEVTYEEDLSIHSEFDFNTTKLPDKRPKKKASNRPSRESHPANNTQRKRKNSPARLAAPLQEGQDALFNISKSFVRNLSVFLILAIIVLLIYDFFRGSALYGDIEDAVSTQTYTQVLSAYIAVAASLVLFEVLSLLWTMSKPRVRAEYGYRREDVGRGQFSFIFIYLLSYSAFLLSKYIPELNDVLKGIKGALDVFGSLHNALFGLCLAGVISCIARKHSWTL